jgi:adenylyltransferase/sulfurtransferase
VYTTKPLRPRFAGELDPLARQRLLGGFSQEALEHASVMLIGAGGINGQIADGLVRKAVGMLWLLDGDSVAMSDLNRQPFTRSHLGQVKVNALAEVVAQQAVGATEIRVLPEMFTEDLPARIGIECDAVVCGVDNETARVAAARWAAGTRKPLITMAVNYNADFGYCFVQEPGGACYLCLKPGAATDIRRTPCAVGSSIDILKGVGALGLYALDSLFMDRPRAWNYKELSLDGGRNERQEFVAPSPGCAVCRRGESLGAATGP